MHKWYLSLLSHSYSSFEILGITKTWFGSASKIYPEQIQIDKQGIESDKT